MNNAIQIQTQVNETQYAECGFSVRVTVRWGTLKGSARAMRFDDSAEERNYAAGDMPGNAEDHFAAECLRNMLDSFRMIWERANGWQHNEVRNEIQMQRGNLPVQIKVRSFKGQHKHGNKATAIARAKAQGMIEAAKATGALTIADPRNDWRAL